MEMLKVELALLLYCYYCLYYYTERDELDSDEIGRIYYHSVAINFIPLSPNRRQRRRG